MKSGLSTVYAPLLLTIALVPPSAAQIDSVHTLLWQDVRAAHHNSVFSSVPLTETQQTYSTRASDVIPALQFYTLSVHGRYHWGQIAVVGRLGTTVHEIRQPEDWEVFARRARYSPRSESEALKACIELVTLFDFTGHLRPGGPLLVLRDSTDMAQVPAGVRDAIARSVAWPRLARAGDTTTVHVWVVEPLRSVLYRCRFDGGRALEFSTRKVLETFGFMGLRMLTIRNAPV